MRIMYIVKLNYSEDANFLLRMCIQIKEFSTTMSVSVSVLQIYITYEYNIFNTKNMRP